MIDLSRSHKLIVRDSLCLLYPVPVIENKKYLIEVETQELGELIIWGLKTDLLLSPLESFYALRVHSDASTSVLAPAWTKIRFRLFDKRSSELNSYIDRIESILSQALVSWAQCHPSERAAQLSKLQNLWQAQKKCQTCISLGITRSKFQAEPPPPLRQIKGDVR
jgi:hypothetical protein